MSFTWQGKVFYEYVGQKRKPKKNVGPLLNNQGELLTENGKRMELLNSYYDSIFTNKKLQLDT